MEKEKFQYDGRVVSFADLLKMFDNGIVLRILCENLKVGQTGTINDLPITRIS